MPTNRFLEFSSRKSTYRIVIVFMCVLCAVFLLQMYIKAYKPVGSDFKSYLLAAKALQHGGNPYDTGYPQPYIYPLFLAFVLGPVSLLPYWLSNLLWFGLSVFALVYSTKIILEESGQFTGLSWERRAAVYIGIMLVVFSDVVQRNLWNGQVNIIVLFLCLLFLKYRQKPVWSLLCLAAAISIKIMPALFVFYLLIRRHYAQAVATLLFTAGFLLLPACFYGTSILRWYSYYLHSFFGGQAAQGDIPWRYFSLAAFYQRLAPDAPMFWLRATSAAVILVIILLIDGLRKSEKPDHGIISLSLYMGAMLLISPMSEIHHIALLFPAALVLGARLLSGATDKAYRILAGLFLINWILGCTVKTGPFLFFSIVVVLVMLSRELMSRNEVACCAKNQV